MSIQSVFSSSISSDYQSKFQETASAFKDLESALESNDLSAAKTAFATIQKNAPSKSGSSTGSSDFDDLASALSSGDMDAAKKAFTNIKSHMPKGPQGADGRQGSQKNSMEKDFDALSSALESGDLDAAKEAFSTIQSHMAQRPDGSSSGTDTTSLSNTATSTSSSGTTIKDLFDQLSSALDSGDLSSAKSLFSSLQSAMQSHHGQNTTDSSTTSSEATYGIDLTT